MPGYSGRLLWAAQPAVERDSKLIDALSDVDHEVIALVVARAARRGRVDECHPRRAARIVVGHLQPVHLRRHLGYPEFDRYLARTSCDRLTDPLPTHSLMDEPFDDLGVAPPQLPIHAILYHTSSNYHQQDKTDRIG